MEVDIPVQSRGGSRKLGAERELASAVEEFARAAKQATQYPVDHPIGKDALQKAREALARLSASAPDTRASLTTYAHKLTVNTVPLPDSIPSVDWLNRCLRRRLIKTVYISANLHDTEVSYLIHALNIDPRRADADGEITDWISQGGSGAICIEEQNYCRILRESEAVLLRLVTSHSDGPLRDLVNLCKDILKEDIPESSSPLFASAASSTSQMMVSHLPLPDPPASPSEDSTVSADRVPFQLDVSGLVSQQDASVDELLAAGIANLLQAGYEHSHDTSDILEQWLSEAIRLILALEAGLRAGIFRAATGVSQGFDDALAVIASRLSIEQILDDIVFAHAGAIVEEQSLVLERLLRRIMPTLDRMNKVEPALQTTCLERGFSSVNYRNIIGILLDKLTQDFMLSARQSSFYLHTAMEDGSAVRESFNDLLASLQPSAVARSRVQMFLALLSLSESLSFTEYSNLCSDVAASVDEYRRNHDTAIAQELLEALSRQVDEQPIPTRKTLAMSALNKVASPEVMSWIAERLRFADEGEGTRLADLLIRCGSSAGGAVLSLLLDHECQQAVALTAQALARAHHAGQLPVVHVLATDGAYRENAPPAAQTTIETLRCGQPQKALRLLDVLLSQTCNELASIAAVASLHPSERVRIESIRAVSRTPSNEAAFYLLNLLDDSDPLVRLEAVRSLKAIHKTIVDKTVVQLVPKLIAIGQGLRSRLPVLRQEAIELLGYLGRPEATAFLASLFIQPGWSLRRRKDLLAQAAATALARIPGEDAEAALQEGQRSKRTVVALACQASLVLRHHYLSERKTVTT